MIAKMKLVDSTCHYPECHKRGVGMVGVRCELCCSRFCMSHALSEVHGCGQEANRRARERIREGCGGRRMDGMKRAQLQRKLDSRIEDLWSEKKRKKKQSPKGND